MNTSRWQQVQKIFKEVLELDRDRRASRLEDLRNSDPELYKELQSLLEADADPSSILDGYVVDSVDLSELFSMEGIRIGAYEIEHPIGTGGMGSVYLARRVKGGFEQQVALKLIKLGLDSERVQRRFEEERSILSRLQHPNIARIIDGGLTEKNRPWFAMEYVQGESIDRYCKKQNLPISLRLKLFLKIVSAVQYAHRNLIIHRDLKPANILVSEGDKSHSCQIKLLDFGIARMIRDTDNEPSGFKSMTRAYASPEQLRGDRTTTLSDIYALGIILYELLAGCHPDPEYRKSDCKPEKIDKELASICRKAMQPFPEDRYETVVDMSEEISNWLSQKPVSSYSNRPTYRIGKLLTRNRISASVVGTSLFAVILLIFIYTRQLKLEKERAERAADRASKVTEVMGNALRSVDPLKTASSDISARTMLDHSLEYIGSELDDDPASQSRLLHIMAGVYSNLGFFGVADSLSLASLGLYRTHYDTTDAEYIGVLVQRSDIMLRLGQFEQAGSIIQRAVYLADRYLDPNSLEHANTYLQYNDYLYERGHYEKVDSVLKDILPVYQKHRSTAEEDYLDVIFYLGTNYRKMGMYDSAEVYLIKSLALSRAFYPGIHENIASNLNHLSSLYQNMGDYEKALPYALESFEQRSQIFGPDHINTVASQANMARALSGAGRLQDAAEAYRVVIEKFRNLFGEENHNLVGLLQSYGTLYLRMGDYITAEPIIRESLSISEKLLPENDIRRAYPLFALAETLLQQKRYANALPYARKALDIRASVLAGDNPLLAKSKYLAGLCLWEIGNRDEAMPLLSEALSIFNRTPELYEPQVSKLKSMGIE